MSYTIEYNRQFIKSDFGVTPVWLAGDSNTRDIQSQRRSRSWSCFHNLIGVTERDIMEAMELYLGGYNEHWKKNGKYLDDKALIRWVHSGVKNAATLEQIIEENRGEIRDVNCYLSVWGEGFSHKIELSAACSTTENFDVWIAQAKRRIAVLRAAGKSAYPIVDFHTEGLRHPKISDKPLPENVLIKSGKDYIYQYDANELVYGPSIKKAKVFTREEAISFQDNTFSPWARKGKLIDAIRKDLPYNAVIMFDTGLYAGQYIEVLSRKIRLYDRPEYATHYPTVKIAECALEKHRLSCSRYGTLKVAVDNSTDD